MTSPGGRGGGSPKDDTLQLDDVISKWPLNANIFYDRNLKGRILDSEFMKTIKVKI